jgi:hypothetical protein
MRLATNCATAYRLAEPRIKRQFNEAVFEEIVVRDGRVAEARYQAPFGGSSRPSSNKLQSGCRWSGRRASNPLPQPWQVEALLRRAGGGPPEFDMSGFVPVALLSSATYNRGGSLP